jgi:hypothetical protein
LRNLLGSLNLFILSISNLSDFQETALEMIRTIREAFNELLTENHWMDDETRAVAKKKADSMNERIGYPEFLKDSVELSMEYVMVIIFFVILYIYYIIYHII